MAVDVAKLKARLNALKGLRQPHLVLLGIAADEAHRAIAGEKGPKYETNAYPLVEMGVSKAMEAGAW